MLLPVKICFFREEKVGLGIPNPIPDWVYGEEVEAPCARGCWHGASPCSTGGNMSNPAFSSRLVEAEGSKPEAPPGNPRSNRFSGAEQEGSTTDCTDCTDKAEERSALDPSCLFSYLYYYASECCFSEHIFGCVGSQLVWCLGFACSNSLRIPGLVEAEGGTPEAPPGNLWWNASAPLPRRSSSRCPIQRRRL